MKTNDLIDALAADLAPRIPPQAALVRALVTGLAATAVLFFVVLGMREDVAAALESARVLAKPVVALVLAVSALAALMRLARPGACGAAGLLLAAPLVAAAFVAAELVSLPVGDWRAALMGENPLACLLTIPALSLPVLAALIVALRHGAPTSPLRTGAVAGLAAAGFAAALYALFCTDDSPLFVAVWYTAAAAIAAAAGALAGRRWLRW